MRLLLLVLIWLPHLALADVFDPATSLRLEQALQRLGYTLEAPGAPLDYNLEAVLHYRSDFGLPEDVTLSATEAADLLRRAATLDQPVALVRGSPQIASGPRFSRSLQDTVFSAHYDAPAPLFASPRHALAHEMRALARPYQSGDALDPDLKTWQTQEIARAKQWLTEDIQRIEATDPVGGLMGKTLIELDLHLDYFGDLNTPDEMKREVFPRLAILIERFPKTVLGPDLSRALNERLMGYLGTALSDSKCDPRHRLERRWSDLGVEIIRRFEADHPGAPELLGFARSLAQCADDPTAARLLAWRAAAARATGDAAIAKDSILDQAKDAFERGDNDQAKRAIQPLLGSGTMTRDDWLKLPNDMILDLGLGQYLGPALVAEFEAMRGQKIDDRVGMANLMEITKQLLTLGYGFEVTDRVFVETDNLFKQDGDILHYYGLVTQMMIDSGQGTRALPPLERLIDRAQMSGNGVAAETFRAQQIDVLLDLGRFSEAEDRISAFIATAGNGARDARVAPWQTRLNLVSNEGEALGTVYARQMSGYLDALCRGFVPPITDFPPEEPEVDRDAVYADPLFLSEARRWRLSERIVSCIGNENAIKRLDRLGCYLWTKDGDLARLTTKMQAWLTAVRRDDQRNSAIVFDDAYMACPMGIAEAGRNDLLAAFMAQIDNASTETGIVLLKLATLHAPDYARWVLARLDLGQFEGHDVPFAALEAAAQLHDPRAISIRQAGIGDFITQYAGASADPAEVVTIQKDSLDLAGGYTALNLDGIARFFLESAEPDADTAPDTDQVVAMLADADAARFALAMGRLALKDGDSAEAISYVAPLVHNFVERASSNSGDAIDDLGPWAKRLQGFVELYLSALASDPARLAAEPAEKVLAAQQLLAAAEASATSGRLAARLSSNDPALVRDYQDALKDLRGAMMAATQGGDSARVAQMREKVTRLRQEIALRDPGFAANARLSIASVAQIRAQAKGRAVVVLTTLPDHLLVTTVTEQGTNVRAVTENRAQIAAAIAAFRATILAEQDVVTPDATVLSAAVLGGLTSLPEGITFVLDGTFVPLPFAALPVRVAGTNRYLGAETAVSITPSLALLAIAHGDTSRPASRPFLGVGDAQFSDAGALGRLGFRPAKLRETSAELRFMGALLGADVKTDLLLGSSASEMRLRDMSERGDLARYRVIAFATHGFMAEQGKLTEAGLLLTEPPFADTEHDGVLSVSEIYRLKLDADLVILSACDTGAVAGGANGFSDLAQAFTYAGARGLIVTHWDIDSHAATEISKRLATQMKAQPGEPVSESYRKAVRALLQDAMASKFHPPKFWASHTVVGL